MQLNEEERRHHEADQRRLRDYLDKLGIRPLPPDEYADLVGAVVFIPKPVQHQVDDDEQKPSP